MFWLISPSPACISSVKTSPPPATLPSVSVHLIGCGDSSSHLSSNPGPVVTPKKSLALGRVLVPPSGWLTQISEFCTVPPPPPPAVGLSGLIPTDCFYSQTSPFLEPTEARVSKSLILFLRFNLLGVPLFCDFSILTNLSIFICNPSYSFCLSSSFAVKSATLVSKPSLFYS